MKPSILGYYYYLGVSLWQFYLAACGISFLSYVAFGISSALVSCEAFNLLVGIDGETGGLGDWERVWWFVI